MNSEFERECVRALQQELGKDVFVLTSPRPPAPDVSLQWPDGATQAFEVTEVHPDEVPRQGSAMRAREERRARAQPNELATTWLQTDSMPAIAHRVAEKVGKANSYALGVGEPLTLLLVGALRQPAAVAATFVIPQALVADRLRFDPVDEKVLFLLKRLRFRRRRRARGSRIGGQLGSGKKE